MLPGQRGQAPNPVRRAGPPCTARQAARCTGTSHSEDERHYSQSTLFSKLRAWLRALLLVPSVPRLFCLGTEGTSFFFFFLKLNNIQVTLWETQEYVRTRNHEAGSGERDVRRQEAWLRSAGMKGTGAEAEANSKESGEVGRSGQAPVAVCTLLMPSDLFLS